MRLGEAARRAGYRLNTFEQLGSTSDEALARALAGDRGRLWIAADRQTAGRGRKGREWASPAGNLMCSVLLIDAVDPVRASQLSFVAGIALIQAIDRIAGETGRVAIKWPNDILIDGGKAAGVLVEGTRTPARSFATVVGFGVNCRANPTDLAYRASNLSVLSLVGPTRETVFQALSETWVECLSIWQAGRRFDEIRDMWLQRATPAGTPMTVSGQGARLQGRFSSMDAQGRLLLETPEGLMTIDVGDVALAERSAETG